MILIQSNSLIQISPVWNYLKGLYVLKTSQDSGGLWILPPPNFTESSPEYPSANNMSRKHKLKQLFPTFTVFHLLNLTRKLLVEGRTEIESQGKVGRKEGLVAIQKPHKHPKYSYGSCELSLLHWELVLRADTEFWR